MGGQAEILVIMMVLVLLVILQCGLIFWSLYKKEPADPNQIVELQGIQIDTLAHLDEQARRSEQSKPVYLYSDPFQQAQEAAYGAQDEQAVAVLRNFFVNEKNTAASTPRRSAWECFALA